MTRLPSSSVTGSSPLARGLPVANASAILAPRIIPARAGFTGTWLPLRRPSGDHPRSRGVYDDDLADMPLSDRIIPARAGFTGFTGSATAYRQDHPRSRGVYRAIKATDPDRHGSSPLARGLHADHEWRRRVRRIIPARAGFTGPSRAVPGGATDHPRSRGVYSDRGGTARPPDGSSPLARGLLTWTLDEVERSRIIPARAGFTLVMESTTMQFGDHPRSRGVYLKTTDDANPDAGSSPLARGLPSPNPKRRTPPRIIPARAGFTLP